MVKTATRNGHHIQAARELRSRGYGIAWLAPGEKNPTRKGWTYATQGPDDYRAGDNLGLMTGIISGGLVCVDLDSSFAIELADGCLPRTAMVDGRPGKPRSHRWYRVVDVPLSLTSPCASAKALGGGPKTLHYPAPAKIDLLGTGAQAVVPPSLHPSGERRVWDGGAMGEPREVDCETLYSLVSQLAYACGWRPPAPPAPRPSRSIAYRGDTIERARRYLAKCPPAISGAGGHSTLMSVTRGLVSTIGLDPEDAYQLLACEYSLRCSEPWSEREIRHKIDDAIRTSTGRPPMAHRGATR